MLAWEEAEHSSFEDSDRFEDESLCSWLSEPESLCNNWRGWKKQNASSTSTTQPSSSIITSQDGEPTIRKLSELCAKTVAAHIPFEVVEQMMPVVPEQIQLWIAYWSFPDNEEDIRLYSCLANGNSDEFVRGENFYKNQNVEDLLQIGFHLNANVQTLTGSKGKWKVAVTFDRGRIITCNCTCNSTASWCSHIVAVCLHRIHQPQNLKLRAPVSESLSRLQRDQLQKFAQYLISELPQQILPTAQKLIDEILSSQDSAINTVPGAPDPTAGASANELTAWLLDENNLHGNIRKILVKFCVPSMVYSDVNFLVAPAPPVATEWQSLLRPLRGREPEGMWNLLSIVREMFKRHDHNAIPLLEIITEECLNTEKILVWWVHTRVALQTGCGGKSGVNAHNNGSQYACASLCDEIVALWRLVALNPALSPMEREMITKQFKDWHMKVLEKVAKNKENSSTNPSSNRKPSENFLFPGFKSAIEACQLDWDDYPLPGITYTPGSSRYYCPVMCCKVDLPNDAPISTPMARLHTQYGGLKRNPERRMAGNKSLAWATVEAPRSPRSSSISSEGFCDNDGGRDSDSIHSPPRSRGNSLEDKSLFDNIPVDKLVENWGAVGAMALDPKTPKPEDNEHVDTPKEEEKPPEVPNKKPGGVFSTIKKLEDPVEILLARAEGLHAHGHVQEASNLAIHLAEQLLRNPPNMMHDLVLPTTRSRKRKIYHANQQLTNLPSATLAKCAFLCSVLAENPENTHLAFQVALFGLEIPRPPALTKPLEVKLANQESDLVSLLKRLPLGNPEIFVIRQRAEQLRSGTYNARGEALLPLMLAAFIFDALVPPNPPRVGSMRQTYHTPSDEKLGFEAAVSALGMKANISEADHPLLCEGTRRQRGDLALTLLTHYKDNKERLAIIMDKFLDKEIHQMYKAPTLPTYYTNQPSQQTESGEQRLLSPPVSRTTTTGQCTQGTSTWSRPNHFYPPHYESPSTSSADTTEPLDYSMSNLSLQARSQQWVNSGARPKTTSSMSANYPLPDNESREQTADGASGRSQLAMESWQLEYQIWEANKLLRKKQNGNTQSRSENYTANNNQQNWVKRTGPGSDSGSSGNSSDSIGSISSSDKGIAENMKAVESPPLGPIPKPPVSEPVPQRIQPMFTKNVKYKGKRAYPTVPNQPSETSAYFMFELAKTVLNRAGGTSSTSLFKQPPTNTQNHRGPHRALQMCAFQIGLYALGLSNQVTQNWLSRTYSSHVSWISNQALEIGSPALSFLINTWEYHLTPCEAATIADKASRGKDANTIKEAANLALSCLPHAHALNPNEIQRAMLQCKEQSSYMLEEACLAVEGDAKKGGVYPEVLFSVARNWFSLYEARTRQQARIGARRLRESDGDQASSTTPTVSTPSTAPNSIGLQNTANITVQSHQQTVAATMTANISNASMPAFNAANQASSVSYGIPTIPYPMGYNYFPNVQPNIPCMGSQVPVQMYIQSTGLQFPRGQGTVPQPVIPTHMQQLQYFQTPSIPSNMNQAPPLRNPMGNGLPNMGNMGGPTCTNMPVTTSGQHPTIMAPNHPPQNMFPLPYQGGIMAGNYMTSNGTHPMVNTFNRPPHGHIVSHQPNMQQPSPNPAQQQMHGGLVTNQQHLVNNSTSVRYLLNAYRVGMLAMETLARRVQDDRPQAKYAKNPPYGEDVNWLLGIAKKLGTQYLHQFCLCAVNGVVSPFILYDLAVEVAGYLSKNNPALYQQNLRSPILQSLIQKCQQMFIQCTHLKIYYMTPSDYDEFISIVRAARQAFQMTVGGMVEFNELMQAVKRSKGCKKELWQRIATALQQPPTV